eukprot:scaffold405_cov243-Pinguiococcus_pyrenoidosus.AAC.19
MRGFGTSSECIGDSIFKNTKNIKSELFFVLIIYDTGAYNQGRFCVSVCVLRPPVRIEALGDGFCVDPTSAARAWTPFSAFRPICGAVMSQCCADVENGRLANFDRLLRDLDEPFEWAEGVEEPRGAQEASEMPLSSLTRVSTRSVG